MKKYELNKEANKLIKSMCANCTRKTNHKIIISLDHTQTDEEYGIVDINSYQVIQCQGCDSPSFRHSIFCSDEKNECNDGYLIKVFPEFSSPPRSSRIFDDISFSSSPLYSIYTESVNAFNNELYILAAAGLRTTVEELCKELNIKGGIIETEDGSKKKIKNLQGKIIGLAQEDYLSKKNAEILNKLRFMGNSALHDLEKPSKEDCYLAFDIIENVFDSIYHIPSKVKFAEYLDDLTK